MNTDLKISRITIILIIVVIFVHFMFFLLEAVLWMNPAVNNILIDFLNNPVALNYNIQALTLKNLFINQGFYNLFLVIAGIIGLRLIKAGNKSAGYALLLFLCFAGVGAGIVLSLSTKAYGLAILQAVPAAVTFSRLYPDFQKSLVHEI